MILYIPWSRVDRVRLQGGEAEQTQVVGDSCYTIYCINLGIAYLGAIPCNVNTVYFIYPGVGVTKYVCKEEELDKHEWREIISRLQSVRYRDLSYGPIRTAGIRLTAKPPCP